MKLHPKIFELKKRSKAISYSTVSVSEAGELEDFNSLLDKRIIEGYGAIWGTRNMHGEKFLKGAFSKSISDMGPGANSTYQIKFRDQHGKACSLFSELSENEVGLKFRTVPLDAVQWCDDLLVQVRSGTINNYSVGFNPIWDKAKYDEESDSIIYPEVKLFEISSATIPSDLTTFTMRAGEEIEYVNDDVEDFINSLPRSKQVDARILFTRCMTLSSAEPLELMRQALKDSKPSETGLDINYLISKL